MAEDRIARRERHLAKAREEIAALDAAGLRLAGNAFSSTLLLKGEPNASEREGAGILSGADGKALRAALTTLGYAPEDWCALLTSHDGGNPVEPALLRLAIATLEPTTCILCDEAAAQAFRETYVDELSCLGDLNQALLVPGVPAHVLGMRVLNLGGFEAALRDSHQKQVMWAYLKQVPPLGEPY